MSVVFGATRFYIPASAHAISSALAVKPLLVYYLPSFVKAITLAILLKQMEKSASAVTIASINNHACENRIPR